MKDIFKIKYQKSLRTIVFIDGSTIAKRGIRSLLQIIFKVRVEKY